MTQRREGAEVRPDTFITAPGRPRTWIFQANPSRYRVGTSLRIEDRELWCLRQHVKRISANDRVLVWISGTKAGIYAVGTVMTAPIAMSDSPAGMGDGNETHEAERQDPRAWVQYDRVMLEHPILRDVLKTDPVLQGMTILRSPRGTNFKVTETEAAALDVWLERNAAAIARGVQPQPSDDSTPIEQQTIL